MKIIDSIGRCAASLIKSAVAATLAIVILLIAALMLADQLAAVQDENTQLNQRLDELNRIVDEQDRQIVELNQRLAAQDQDFILTVRLELCLFWDSLVIFEDTFRLETEQDVFDACAIGDEITGAEWLQLGEGRRFLFVRVFIEDMNINKNQAA